MKTDKQKQQEMKSYYNNSSYYELAKDNNPEYFNRFNQYLSSNVFNIYYPKENELILDLGCGWGNVSFALLKKGFKVIGIDYAEKAIEFCKKTAKKLNLPDNVFFCREATNTKLKNDSVDVVYCADLVEHLYPEVYLEMLKEIKRILKKGGALIVYTPNPKHLIEIMKNKGFILKKDLSHVNLKNMNYIKTTLNENGFKIKKAYFIESHMFLINIIEKMFMKYFSFLRRRIAILAVKN